MMSLISPEEKKKIYQAEWRKNNKEWLKEWRLKNKEVLNERSKLWNKENKERAYENHKKYRKNNRERVNKIAKESRDKNKEERLDRRRESRKERVLTDPLFKITGNIRAAISMSFKRGNKKLPKKLKTEEILGCSIQEFVDYIMSLCPSGVTISDFHKYGYHIDHIIPISKANTEEEVIKLCHYKNLQPLFWLDNIKKRDKILS